MFGMMKTFKFITGEKLEMSDENLERKNTKQKENHPHT